MGLFGSRKQAAPARATQAPRVPRSYYIEMLTEAGFPAQRAHILPRIGTPESNQRILDDLVAWDRDVAPYIDDLHLRVRRILLEGGEGTILAAPKTKSLLEFMDERREG